MVVYIIKTTQNNASIMNSSAGLLLTEALWTRLEKRRLQAKHRRRRGEVRRRGGGKDRSRSIRREVEKRRGGEEGRRRGEECIRGVVVLLRSSSGGFVYSRFEVGEEEIFLAPIVRSQDPGSGGTIDMYSRGLEVDPSLWGGGEEKRKRGREVETGREGKRKLGEEEGPGEGKA